MDRHTKLRSLEIAQNGPYNRRRNAQGQAWARTCVTKEHVHGRVCEQDQMYNENANSISGEAQSQQTGRGKPSLFGALGTSSWCMPRRIGRWQKTSRHVRPFNLNVCHFWYCFVVSMEVGMADAYTLRKYVPNLVPGKQVGPGC